MRDKVSTMDPKTVFPNWKRDHYVFSRKTAIDNVPQNQVLNTD